MPSPSTLALLPKDPVRHVAGQCADYKVWQANVLVFVPAVPFELDDVSNVPSSTPSLTHSSPTKPADDPALPPTAELQDLSLGAGPSSSSPLSHHVLRSLAPPDGLKVTITTQATTASLTVTLDSWHGSDGLFDVYNATIPQSTEPILAHVCWTGSPSSDAGDPSEIAEQLESQGRIHDKLSRLGVPSAPRFYGLWRGDMQYQWHTFDEPWDVTIYVLLLGRNGERFVRWWGDMTFEEVDIVRAMYEQLHTYGIVTNIDESSNVLVRPDGSYGLAYWQYALFEDDELYESALEAERELLEELRHRVLTRMRYEEKREEEYRQRLGGPVT